MSFLLWHAGSVGLAGDRRVLRAGEVAPLAHALALIERVEALSARTAEQQRAAEAAGREAGLAMGAEAARQAAQAALADELARLARRAQADRERAQRDVAQLALEVARRLVGELPAPERLAGLAAQAARELLPARTWRLSVHPSQVAPLQARLRQLDPQDRTGLGGAEVCADASLPAEVCRLETDLGSALAGLDDHLQRLARAWAVNWPPEAVA
ncbi:MAG TPA: FliH/SctL family protein [Ideonella sp.]|nr:FliH/SctL family protein [Ideonella sp.]